MEPLLTDNHNGILLMPLLVRVRVRVFAVFVLVSLVVFIVLSKLNPNVSGIIQQVDDVDEIVDRWDQITKCCECHYLCLQPSSTGSDPAARKIISARVVPQSRFKSCVIKQLVRGWSVLRVDLHRIFNKAPVLHSDLE